MVAPGGFNEEDTSPTVEQPDVEVVDYTPQGRAATSPTAGLDLDGNNFGKPHPQTTHQAIINISTPDLNRTRGTDQQPPPSDFFNTLATHQSPTDGTEELPSETNNVASAGPGSIRSVDSPALSLDSTDNIIAGNEQELFRAKQRVINQIRETARMTAVYKKDRAIIESIGGVVLDAIQVFSELKAEHPVPFKAMVDVIEHLSPVFGYKPAP